MRKDMEHILHLVADYRDFCNNEPARNKYSRDSEELSMEELDLVAAAAGQVNDIPPIDKLIKAAQKPLI